MKPALLIGFCAVSAMAQDPAGATPVVSPEMSAWYRLDAAQAALYKWMRVDPPLTLTVDGAGTPHLSAIPAFTNTAPATGPTWVEFTTLLWDASVDTDPPQVASESYKLRLPSVPPKPGQVMTFNASDTDPAARIGAWITTDPAPVIRFHAPGLNAITQADGSVDVFLDVALVGYRSQVIPAGPSACTIDTGGWSADQSGMYFCVASADDPKVLVWAKVPLQVSTPDPAAPGTFVWK